MRNAIINLAARRSHGQHPGLLLQRYLSAPAPGADGIPKEKRALLDAAIAAAKNPALQILYKAAYERWQKTVQHLTTANDFDTAGRLIVGLGSENVLETGIRLHHTYGLPIIPGSALKGLAAHYCHEVWGQLAAGDDAPVENQPFRRPTKEEDLAYRKFLQGKETKPPDNFHRLLFGTTDDSGCVTFHDAWLTLDTQAPLVLDVMTPHHPKWLDGALPPTDFDSPVPVPFLSVHASFWVAVSWTGPDSDKARDWTNLTFALLAEALREWGIGGKTSSGYGRLAERNPEKRRLPLSALGLPAIGTLVEATLHKAPKKNQPWRATFVLSEGRELSGPIEPIEQTPDKLQPGGKVRLLVKEATVSMIRFLWPK